MGVWLATRGSMKSKVIFSSSPGPCILLLSNANIFFSSRHSSSPRCRTCADLSIANLRYVLVQPLDHLDDCGSLHANSVLR